MAQLLEVAGLPMTPEAARRFYRILLADEEGCVLPRAEEEFVDPDELDHAPCTRTATLRRKRKRWPRRRVSSDAQRVTTAAALWGGI